MKFRIMLFAAILSSYRLLATKKANCLSIYHVPSKMRYDPNA